MSQTCLLCESHNSHHYFRDKKRDYFQCNQCYLVFVPPEQHLTSEQEKAEYDKHQNSLDDQGYLTFLARTMDPLTDLIPPPATGMDYGCGPAPALANAMNYRGYSMSTYDPYYFPDTSVLSKQYDFITCTEVIEHIAKPMEALRSLSGCLKPNGVLAIMTKRVIDQDRFANWHYKNDPTHIAFYSDQTFLFIAEQFTFDLTFISADVIFLKS
ncbi:MAG: class I SAM-dependent methyltransferase [Gammaproteobacteria bacterium]|nr:class I SAM-dependent methyltransferase [Gammaproteobacteria bacterium]